MKKLFLGSHVGCERVALVDADVFERVNQFSWTWQAGGTYGYAIRKDRRGGKRVTVLLQREVLEITDPDLKVSFQNGCSLDCRRGNLISRRIMQRWGG